jgi:trk system potassium uptake protein TrkH
VNILSKKKISPSLKIIIGLLISIVLGSILLVLPISMKSGASANYIDALFMSFSSVCITGLNIYESLNVYSVFGLIIISILTLIGALGFVTITLFILSLFGINFDVSDTAVIQETIGSKSLRGISKLLKEMIIITASFILFGTILYMITFASIINFNNFFDLFFYSLFHAISTYCNTGYTLYDLSFAVTISNNIMFNITNNLLVIFGGLGYLVVIDLIMVFKLKKITFHSKIVLVTSAFLIVLGTVLLKLGDSKMSFVQSLFLAINARTSGFTTFDINNMTNSNNLVLIFLMFIGGSPASFAGGIKTTTFFVFIITLISYARGKAPTAFYKKIADQSIIKAFTIALLSVFLIFIAVLFIVFIEKESHNISDIIFNIVSSFSNTGLALGKIGDYLIASKIIFALMMFIGRIGPITIVTVWNKNAISKSNIGYMEERVIVG